jgi:hypothetical protein
LVNEKPATPVETPQCNEPRAFTSSSVPAAAAPAPSAAIVSAPSNTLGFIMSFSLLSAQSRM